MITSLDRKLLRDIWRLKGQVLAIALVMACGVAVVLMSFGTMRSLQDTRDAYYERYRFAHVFAHVKRAPLFLVDRLATIRGVAAVEARIVATVTLDVPGMVEPASARLQSLPTRGRPALNDVVIRSGRALAPDAGDEALVSEAFALAHGLGPGDRIAAIINGRKRSLAIVGLALSPEFTYTLGPGQIMPDDRRFGVLWMGREALEAAFDLKGAFNDVALALGRDASEPQALAAVDRILEPYGGVGAYGRRDQQSDAFLSGELDQLAATGRIIPPIFLAIAAFLLNIVVSRLVDTERELIGLLKAFGYSGVQVGWHYLKLVLLIAALGGTLGIAFGLWLGSGITRIYAEHFRLPFLYYHLDADVLIVALAVSFTAAVAGTALAVRRAILLPPAVAMAPPIPTRYRLTLAERLGLMRLFDQPSRMVLRHLMRYPVRALLSMTAIAMAGAILIVALFSFDAIDHLMDTYFFQAQRQDVTLTFEATEPARVAGEVARLPGVLTVESFRSVPARLRHGHLSRRVALLGAAEGADLSRLLDYELRPVALPDEGLVLSRALARRLGAGLGDRVIVEAMEGRRPVVMLPVSAIVEEYVGLSATMSLAALNRMMGEAPSVSGLNLSLDRAAETDFYRAVKATPALAGVTLKRAAVESFRATIAETMYIVIGFYVLFAGMIAFGVLYNGARITLSERARELASLRVLGFTRAEAAYVLLAQLGLLSLAALPLGSALGYGFAWLITAAFDTELFRIPLVVLPRTFGVAALGVVAATIASGAIVGFRVARLDLVTALKTRE